MFVIFYPVDYEILINSVANTNKNSYFCITIESRCGAHSKTQKIICGEIGGLKKENFIIIYISIRYKSVTSPRRITERQVKTRLKEDNSYNIKVLQEFFLCICP